MRQIGQGQKIHLFIIPEVAQLISDHIKACGPGSFSFFFSSLKRLANAFYEKN